MDGIVNLVVLEQLVIRLPKGTAEWIQCHCLASLEEVIQLATFPRIGGHLTPSLSGANSPQISSPNPGSSLFSLTPFSSHLDASPNTLSLYIGVTICAHQDWGKAQTGLQVQQERWAVP